jgi:histone-lysine N-methyltransferase SETDB1
MEGVPQKSISNGGHKNGKPKRKKIKIDWICINPDCTKSRSDNVITAKPFVISYFGAKMDEKRKRKVCRDCYVQAKVTTDAMVAKLMSKESVITEPLPTVHDAAVILDDSDEDDLAKTDSSDDSELEFELENETLESLVEDTLKKFGLTEQLDGAIESLTQRLGAINPDVQEIDANFASIEKQVDDMRKALYAPFKPEIKHLPPLIIQDNSSQVPIPSSGGASSTVTNPNLTALPPVGVLNRPPLKLNDKVIAMRGNILNVWKDGSVNEISTLPQDETNPYKIRFEVWMSGRLKNAHHRKLQLKHIAYTVPATVKLQVGTRIIGVYTDPENPTSTTDFYSGIVAEPPKTMNALRYLVFFDDGYASYIRHEDLRVVCQQTENAVWEDIHPNSRDFVKKYLMQYPERPMVKLSIGQPVTVEWEGSWWHAKVEGVDASLVKVVFAVNSRREAIYRGSTRLGPLYKQMQQQKRSAEIGAKFSRRNHTANRGGRPYVEYTKLTDENSLSMQQSLAAVNAALGVTPAGPQQEMPKRATARKSTAGNKKNDLLPSSRPDPNRPKWESKGSVRDLEVEIVEGVNFIKHQCSPLCMDDTKFLYDENKIITKDEKLKHFNPLLVPVILGWKRQITKHKNFGKRSVYYVSPCGRRLRNLEEIHRYLRVTHSTLEIDFFNFEWYVQVYKFFTPERKFYQIDDISYGKENVQVSCVNSLDNNYPEYVEYSTVRLPQKNVDIPMSEGFLTCCDCTDDCQDKDRCACWQLTISSTAASNPDATVNPNVGCEYRRLHEPVSTGIYECNQYCKCKKTCLNRIAQHPIRAQLQVGTKLNISCPKSHMLKIIFLIEFFLQTALLSKVPWNV